MLKKYFISLFVLCVLTSCGRPAQSNNEGSSSSSEEAVRSESGVSVTDVEDVSDLSRVEIPELLSQQPQQVISHLGYTVSHNPDWNIPNWVAYSLTKEEVGGDIPRAKKFNPDPDVDGVAVVTSDYTHSGYDRGHMAPAADMKWSMKAMNDCFYMTNICPQDGGLNSGSWQTLEKACRRWAKQEGKVYVVCGPVYKSTKPKKIGKEHEISVPDGFYKVVLSMREGKEKAIGFYYENRSGKQEMKHVATSVDEIETLTGINFFVNVPDKLEDKIEATYSLKLWK
jgi:endonuclease G